MHGGLEAGMVIKKWLVLGSGMARSLVLMLQKDMGQWVRGDPESWYAAVKAG